MPGVATLIAKSPGVLAGGEVARSVFLRADANLRAELLMEDGATLQPGDAIGRVEGPVGGILRAERCALNFLQHMSGIATETARYVGGGGGDAERPSSTRARPRRGCGRCRSTRCWWAAAGTIAWTWRTACSSRTTTSLRCARRRWGWPRSCVGHKEGAPHTLKVEIEVESMEEAREAVEARADIILLDNMTPEEMRRVVEMIGGRALVEASGGITLDTVREVAETGVDIISVGALTHSVTALNISLDLDATWG